MAIVCFRNMLDPKMKRLGSFLKRIQEKHSSNVTLIYSPRKYDYIQAISSNIDATFIIVAHGSENEIYHRLKTPQSTPPQILLGTHSEIFPKKVIASSCGSGKNLGPTMIGKGQCQVYLGFKSKIHFDKKYPVDSLASARYTMHIQELYKTVFEKILEKSINEEWTFEKLSRILQWELKRESVIQAKKIKISFPHSYIANDISQTIIAATNVASNIVLLGNELEIVN